LHLDSDHVVADKISVIKFYGSPEVLADSVSDESFDFGRRHSAHGPGTLRLSTQKG
jgi:hypothetical protein